MSLAVARTGIRPALCLCHPNRTGEFLQMQNGLLSRMNHHLDSVNKMNKETLQTLAAEKDHKQLRQEVHELQKQLQQTVEDAQIQNDAEQRLSRMLDASREDVKRATSTVDMLRQQLQCVELEKEVILRDAEQVKKQEPSSERRADSGESPPERDGAAEPNSSKSTHDDWTSYPRKSGMPLQRRGCHNVVCRIVLESQSKDIATQTLTRTNMQCFCTSPSSDGVRRYMTQSKPLMQYHPI